MIFLKKILTSIFISIVIIISSYSPCLAYEARNNGEPSLNDIYKPPEHSREELYQDIFISLLLPDIQREIDNYYKEFLTDGPMVAPYTVYVLSAERLEHYRSFIFRVKLKVDSYIGPHLDIGVDNITILIGAGDKPKIEKFQHVKSYYLDLPPNYQNIIKKKSMN